MKRTLPIWALIFGLLPAAHGQVKGVTAELHLAQEQLLADEDMVLSLQIENRSGQDLKLGSDSDWISFTVIGENEKLAPQVGETPLAHEFTISSGHGSTCKFNLTPYYDIHAPGRYRIEAKFKIPQANQLVTVKPVSFSVVKGMPLPKLPDIQFGVPPLPGQSNATGEVRRYSLQKADMGTGQMLYFLLSDASGVHNLKVFPLGAFVSISDPESQVDHFSNLHVLNQTGAREFTYHVINPDGVILYRETYAIGSNGSHPKLTSGVEGRVVVTGGVRRLSETDIPKGVQLPGATPPP